MPHLIPSKVDLVIIGGGINGAGLAAQAAQAGLSVVLFEKDDFASGTSSKSTKLFHGGIRYLEQARFSLVFEGLHERNKLLTMVPHLARPVSFLLPVYKGDQRPAWMLKIGLMLYDLLAGSHNIAKHQWFSPQEALAKAPALRSQGLKGCGLYYDLQTNDARLVLENILAAEQAGAKCFNYHQVTDIDQEAAGYHVTYWDDLAQKTGTLFTSCLVNASGPWANETAEMISSGADKLVRPTRGTHIVVPEILTDHAVLITTKGDNRIIFVIPWRGYSLIGTTDIDDSTNPDSTHPTQEEIDYLIEQAARVFPGASLTKEKVISAFAGLRPLAWGNEKQASSVSREDQIIRKRRLITIVGGKLTTYHLMAQHALQQVMQILDRKNPNRAASLPGLPDKPWVEFLKTSVANWMVAYDLTAAQADHLAHLYGQRAEQVLALTKENAKLKQPLHPDRPELGAQVIFAVQKEKALHLDDVMLRRLEIGYSAQRWGQSSETASHLMAQELEWDEDTRLKELEAYRTQLFPQPPR
ncbi:MAG TPA: glycerol-3-phosphate dehydrogenase [bacterium]|nr:glycerol-3-phosphate dehydrogenase [bacterium]